ncbi:uncharacterized protein [Neodiprion pinetum]|uniref:Uncharacterized protein LOC107220159 n=1 Tax=Neodiprion lecontei TaxID=441921 RepID=A0A6J0BJY1_NEOLC|nr:uncharacterized protein LOC107220159 [Neodiprion lecontei]
MRFVCIFLFTVTALVDLPGKSAGETCPMENCMSANRCDTLWKGAECPNKQEVCCSVVKRHQETSCRHYGGECLNNCNQILKRPGPCPGNKVCCVLVD